MCMLVNFGTFFHTESYIPDECQQAETCVAWLSSLGIPFCFTFIFVKLPIKLISCYALHSP